jgi:nucleoid-associated protein YgaU
MKRVIPEVTVTSYTVKKNDTLSSIARKLTGSTDYSAIYQQNKDQIGSNPNNITAGMVLVIPRNESTTD